MAGLKLSANELLDQVIRIAHTAGRAVMEVYGTDHAVKSKSDQSPVTEADVRAEAIILAALRILTPDVPIVAEESVAGGEVPSVGTNFWLVDTLDGTKEFIGRNGTLRNPAAMSLRNSTVIQVPKFDPAHARSAGRGLNATTAAGPRAYRAAHACSSAGVVALGGPGRM